MLALTDIRIGVIGLGYVGLPLALEFSKVLNVVGFDINKNRIAQLKGGHDNTREVSEYQLAEATSLFLSTDIADLRDCNFYIVTVPTPVNEFLQPDLTALFGASEIVGKVISKGNIVVYESTVYPGATEDECLPVVERNSGFQLNRDFFAGYSPERINPGDHARRLPDIKKVTSGSTPEAAQLIDAVYRLVIRAGTHLAPSIRVAEAAKVIENTQRDLNIALMNELAIIFNRMEIDTQAVLEAAGTKWNFLPFKPGLVGGHCIGVDPYYLTYKAQSVGYYPQVILAGRRLNEGMGVFVAEQMVKAMIRKSLPVNGARILVLGISFKEDCPDLRNTRVIDIVRFFQSFGAAVDIHDPCVNPAEMDEEFGLSLCDAPEKGAYDGILIAVAHRQFIALGAEAVKAWGKPNHVLFDLKSVFSIETSDMRL